VRPQIHARSFFKDSTTSLGLGDDFGSEHADFFICEFHPDLRADTVTRGSAVLLVRSKSAGRPRVGGQLLANSVPNSMATARQTIRLKISPLDP